MNLSDPLFGQTDDAVYLFECHGAGVGRPRSVQAKLGALPPCVASPPIPYRSAHVMRPCLRGRTSARSRQTLVAVYAMQISIDVHRVAGGRVRLVVVFVVLDASTCLPRLMRHLSRSRCCGRPLTPGAKGCRPESCWGRLCRLGSERSLCPARLLPRSRRSAQPERASLVEVGRRLLPAECWDVRLLRHVPMPHVCVSAEEHRGISRSRVRDRLRPTTEIDHVPK